VAEETEAREHGATARQSVDPLTLAMSRASPERADELLEKQSRLVDLQIEELRKEDRIRHWSLRVRHIGDILKLSFQLGLACLVLAAVFGVAAATWSASHDSGLIIEPFSVPPDLASKGLTGQVVASQVLDKLSALQAATDSSRAADTYASNWGNDIRVQIPDTGVSIGELYRYLVGWLGSETHISGEVYRKGSGIAITARTGSDAGQTFVGSETDLDSLTQKAAESIYARTQPYRYGRYLDESGRIEEAVSVYKQLALHGPVKEQAWGFSGWGGIEFKTGDVGGARDMELRALQVDPDNALPRAVLGFLENGLGHTEAALAAYNAENTILARGDGELAHAAAEVRRDDTQANIAELTGDYVAAIARSKQYEQPDSYAPQNPIVIAITLAADHDPGGALFVSHNLATSNIRDKQLAAVFELMESTWLRTWVAMAQHDWSEYVRLARLYQAFGAKIPFVRTLVLPRYVWPDYAYALGNLGRSSEAHQFIDRTPVDCDLCLRMRGNLDAAEKNWRGAAYWFSIVTHRAPSLPFGYTDWGAMLLAKGDLDDAIAKFALANKRGPHFADPLEMWGEALMLENRSDLARAKFEEASRYAPSWGRLHMKWAEALGYAGQKDEARTQYRVASTLDLSAADKAELARELGASAVDRADR
jgi:tetratricopeptide (TPR) repeat protein